MAELPPSLAIDELGLLEEDILHKLPVSTRSGFVVWIIGRLVYGIVILVTITVVVFVATQALPSDPAQAILGRAAPEQVEALREELGLNRPLINQYLSWLGGIVRGDLGTSLATQAPVSDYIGQRFLNTLVLLGLTSVIAFPVSLSLGALAAYKRDGIADRGGLVTALIATSLPEFVVGMLLVMLFATTVWHILPAVTLVGPAGSPFGNWKAMVLPIVVLTIAVVPYLYRLVRASTIDVLQSHYIHMARLKGLRQRTIIMRHAIPNALVPAIQASALVLAYLLGGIVVVEYLFAYPGLGTALLEAISNRDLPMIQVIVLIFAAGVVVFNLAADVLTVLVTPRLRTGRR